LRHEAPVGSNYVYSGTFDEHIESINGTYLRFAPGEQYSYSNLGIDLVAYALGQIYGMSYEDYMTEKVFTPLGMVHSTFSQNDYLTRIDSAVGHDKNPLVKYPIQMIASGGLYSCPNDMTRFIRCFLNQGEYNGQQIITRENLERMYNEYPPSDKWEYNLGLDVGKIKNRTILNHNGGGFGFLATQDILIDSGLGAAAVTNSVNHPNAHFSIIRNMWDDFFTLQDTGKDDCERIPDNYDSFIGMYEARFNGGTWKLAVIPRNGALFCNNQRLEHHSGCLFFNGKNDCIEFCENGLKYDNVAMTKRVD